MLSGSYEMALNASMKNPDNTVFFDLSIIACIENNHIESAALFTLFSIPMYV